MRRNWVIAALLTAAPLIGYLIYWYAQSPVPTGLYPARLEGIYLDDTTRGARFPLPVIWVRPHPWATLPPELERVELLDPEGRVVSSLEGSLRSPLSWPDRSTPVWLRPRAVVGRLWAPYPDEGFTLGGVRWTHAGATVSRRFETGPLRVVTSERRNGVEVWGFNQWPPEWETYRPGVDLAEGIYLFLSGVTGRTVLGVITGVPGLDEQPEGLLYREGHEDITQPRRYWQDPAYQPLSLPFTPKGPVTIYIPYPDEVRRLMKEVYFAQQPGLVIEGPDGPVYLRSGIGSMGADTRGRRWIPYFVYTYETEPSP